MKVIKHISKALLLLPALTLMLGITDPEPELQAPPVLMVQPIPDPDSLYPQGLSFAEGHSFKPSYSKKTGKLMFGVKFTFEEVSLAQLKGLLRSVALVGDDEEVGILVNATEEIIDGIQRLNQGHFQTTVSLDLNYGTKSAHLTFFRGTPEREERTMLKLSGAEK